MDDMKTKYKGLDRYLSRVDVWAMAFGCMVGWGAFVMPGTTFLPVAGPAGTIIAMALSVLVILIIGSGMSWLIGRSPGTGGLYSYTKEAFGRDHAFLCAWFLCLSYLTIVFLNGSALFLIVRTMFGESIQSGIHYTVGNNEIYLREVMTSVVVLALVGVLFIAAKPFLQKFHTGLAVILLAGVAVTAIVCLPHVSSEIIRDFGIQGVKPEFAVFSLVILAPWAFVGFEITTFETAHFRFDARKSKGIVIISVLAAGFVYMALTLVSISVIPDGYDSWQAYISSLGSHNGLEAVPTFYAAKSLLGEFGLMIIGITAVAAIMTGIIGAYRAMIRVLSTMAEDKILSEKFSNTTYSILFIMILSILISFLGRNTLIWFVDLTSFGAIVAYGYTSAAVFRLARMENNRKIMITGIIGTAIAAVFVVVQLVPELTVIDAMNSEAFLLLSLWCLLGFVFYWRTIRESQLTVYSGMSISGTVMFALLVYSALMWIGKRLAALSDTAQMDEMILRSGIVLMIIIFTGMVVMLYIQKVVREKHEHSEREKIRAVEGSLAKSRFLFNMSHDIRTPMNAIIGYTNLARREESINTVKEYLDKIDVSSKHLLELINDILEMSRIENGHLEQNYEPADLYGLVGEIKDIFRQQMQEKGLEFHVYEPNVKDRYVWCDKKNLNRVMLNLISNAYKFTPEGGSVYISLWENAADEGGYGSYEIRVRDSGIGMSREFVDKMFNAFERERSSTDSGIEGTGLGLAITKNIIDLMGGTIEVVTSPGSGTEVIVCMKMKIAEETEVKSQDNDDTPDLEGTADFTGKRLLLVEDNQINMEIAVMILSGKGFEVETAENGKIAVDMVEASDPGYYDAILMDIQMPVMDGFEAASKIQALDDPQLAGIPILAMTANAFQEDVQAALDAGMKAHIAKPVDVNVLMRELAKVLQ